MAETRLADRRGLSRIAAKVSAGLLTVYSLLQVVLTAFGILLSLFRVIWYPSASPWLVVGCYALAFAIAVWGLREGIRAYRHPAWGRILVLAVAATSSTALMVVGRHLGER